MVNCELFILSAVEIKHQKRLDSPSIINSTDETTLLPCANINDKLLKQTLAALLKILNLL